MNRRFLILFVFFTSLLSAQGNGRWRHITTDDGLAQNSIFSIVQDHQGFMWIATQDGLCRYDGYHYVTFRPDPNDTNSILSNYIRCLLVDREGNLWVGSRNGLNMYDPVKGKFLHFPKTQIPAISIFSLAQDSLGNIWMSTLKDGVYRYDPKTKKSTRFQHDDKNQNSICGNNVRGMVCDHTGHVWFMTWSNGMSEFDPQKNKWTTYSFSEGPARTCYPNSRGALTVDSKNRIWFGTWGRGVGMYDPSSKTITCEGDNTKMIPLMNSGMVWSIHESRDGHIWIATAEEGVFDLDPNTGNYRKFKHDPDDPWSLNDNSIWCVTEDRSGQIWTGAWQGGLNIFDPRLERFALYRNNPKDSNSLPSNTVWSFCSDGANGIWIGTSAGPVHYDMEKKLFHQPHLHTDAKSDPNAPPTNSNIQAICRDTKGCIWMGTAGGGLHCYDPVTDKYRIYINAEKDSNSLQTNLITGLTCDAQGNVWVAEGIGALQRYNPVTDKFDNYAFNPSDSIRYQDGPICVIPAGRGKIVMGLVEGEVFEMDIATRKFTRLYSVSGGNAVECLYRDKIGNLWVGTSGSGMVYVGGEKPIVFTEKDGLPNNVINGIIPGAGDELWLSTNHGICRFDPVKHEVHNFTTEDGLQGNEFNQGAYCKTPDGRIWFGGAKGITSFNPVEIIPNPTPAAAVVTSFTVLNKTWPLENNITFTKDITLRYSDYFFSFEFSGLEFTNPGRNQFKYRMEGFDEDWMDAGTRRYVTYTNLDPGEYIFHVRASNNDGLWGGNETEIHLTITPPFWRTKWFYGLCGFVLVVSVGGYIKWRERALLKEKQILENKVTERTFELSQEKEKVTAAHKDIRDSINYAKRIQYALLASETLLKENLPDYFILFKPKDIVSGDFYWATQRNFDKPTARGGPGQDGKLFYLAACDSTGHGVPGAFMSLLNISFLNEAVIEKKITQPGEIFDHVRTRLIENISQDGGKDGMDAILLCFDQREKRITYAAAHNAPVIIRNGEIIQPDTDKMPVGKGERTDPFKTRTLDVHPGDIVYLYTDGFADQFGGPAGKKFKEGTLRKMLAEISGLPFEQQQQKLDETFENWKGMLEQVDDVLLIGIKI